MTRKFHSVEQVAEMFGTEPPNVRRWIRQGRLRAVNIGTKGRPIYRVSEAELARYEEANTAAA